MTQESNPDRIDSEAAESEAGEPKKVSLADAMKKKLAEKKAQSQTASKQKHGPSGNQSMKSQLTKKPNNQKKRTGV